MPNPSQPLITLLEIAERERDAAAGALLQAEQQLQRLQQQLQQLQQYRAEYDARSPAAGGRAAPIELLRVHQGFMLRLDHALSQQRGVLHAAEVRVVQQRQALLGCEMRVAGVAKLLQRRTREADAQQQRQDQRRDDELALQRHWRSRMDSRLAAL
jgi:flagellar protein FliJ